ncbi:restriction endonuclease subunit S [bacterium]|nr:restriction endonuclease subunit S [bacterium]MBU1959144.1 restriction endonuclease subunit S [bacterium]
MSQVKLGYKQTKIGVIPEDWEVVRSDKVLQRIRKKVNVQKDEKYQQIGIRSHAKGLFHKELVTGETLGNKSVFWIEEDCFIVNIVFAWEQAVAKTTHKERGMIASHRFPMYQAKDNRVDIDYLLYFFKSKRGKHLLGLASPGGAGRNKTLGQGEFNELKLPLPPLKEQQKIAKILTTWDNAIEKQEQLIDQKEFLKKGLMQRLLSGKIRLNEFDSEWKEVRLESITIKMQSGGTPKATNKNYYSGNIPFVKVKDITKNGKYLISTKVSITKEALNSSSAWLVPFNSLIYSMYASIGFVSINKIELATSQAMINIIPNTKIVDLEYLYYYLFDLKKYINKYIETGTQGNLNAQIVKSLKIKLPPLQEQQKIANILTLADKEIDLLKDELSQLKKQKKALMQKLLTGEVRVAV